MKQHQRGVDHPEGPVPPQEVLRGISGDLDFAPIAAAMLTALAGAVANVFRGGAGGG